MRSNKSSTDLKQKLDKIKKEYLFEISINEIMFMLFNKEKKDNITEFENFIINNKDNMVREFKLIANLMASGEDFDVTAVTPTELENLSPKEKLPSIMLETSISLLSIQHYYNMSFIYLFTLLEAFLKDYFTEFFIVNIHLLKTKKSGMSNAELINSESIEDVRLRLIQMEINEIGYKNIDQLNVFFKAKFNINSKKQFPQWKELKENYYRRNIVVHNKGKPSAIYKKKINMANIKIGDKYPLNEEYIKKCSMRIGDYIIFLCDKISKKFNL